MKIGFYPINDPRKEIIASGVFPSMNQAIEVFAQMKNLSPITFLEIYGVRKLED
jgi:hypothetical protein